MIDDILAKVKNALQNSDLIRDVALSRQNSGRALTIGDASLRSLTDHEVAVLDRQGNTADDWARVQVAEGFDCRRVRDSSFHGDNVVGRLSGVVPIGGIDLPAGIYRSTVMDSAIGHGALISDVRLLANSLVGPGAALFDCGRVICTSISTFGSGVSLPLGLEGGGRDVPIYAEIDVEVAAAVASRRRCREFLTRYGELVRSYAAAAAATSNIICAKAVICHTPRVENVYIGPGGRIDGASLVSDTTILSSEQEESSVESGACVTRSILQWGSRVSSMAVLDRTVLTEYSGAERQSKVTESLIGPNTIIAQGEVTASLVGPCVGFHHQALLIAAYWPEGKGNVAAGACVGSNHTSRAPDQEFRPGEGVFLGLGVNIKYPSDFTRSPYLVVACGVTTLPQKLAFPFALITPSSDYRAPSAHNQIIPAWVLTDSLYTLTRNQSKFQARNRARRLQLDSEIFRPEIVDLMRDACERLEAVRERKDMYTESDIPGLGKNYLLEKYRTRAANAYRFFIRFCELRELCARLQMSLGAQKDETHRSFHFVPNGARNELHSWMRKEDAIPLDFDSSLTELMVMARHLAEKVERSRAKDDDRGRQIMGDYADVHLRAAEDPVVLKAWAEAERLSQDVRDVLAHLKHRPTSTRLVSPSAKTPAPVG